MTDEETREFYEKNKEIIDRIIAEKAEEKSKEEKFRDDYLRAMDAADGLRDALSGFIRSQSEYADRFGRGEYERFRLHRELEAERARARAMELRARAREDFYEARDTVNGDFDEFFGFIADPDFQKHVIGAGMELIAAFTRLLQSGPFPESVKDAVKVSNLVRNEEYCRQNPDCRARAPKEGGAQKADPESIKINVKPKGKDE